MRVDTSMRIGIVAGEASGDALGAGLLRAINRQAPGTVIEGIGGPRMQEQGCRSLFPMERLSVMGLVEVVKHLPELRAVQSRLVAHFTRSPPDVFVGIDAPDFNLTLEHKLNRAGIRTVHYVSPTVWAWRRYRLRKIKRAVDHMLVLFPFEAAFYESRGVPVTFVGHPLADHIAFDTDRETARARLALPTEGEIVALLPGSRAAEVRNLAGPFIAAARQCLEQRPGLQFVAPVANDGVAEIFRRALNEDAPTAPPVKVVQGMSLEAMAAADVVLAAGGTATLEAMLLKRPVVMAYKVAPLSYRLARRLVKIQRYSLPNLLAGKDMVPEFIQDRVTAENLAAAVLDYLTHPERVAALRREFTRLHHMLRRDADRRAAEVVLEVAGGSRGAPAHG